MMAQLIMKHCSKVLTALSYQVQEEEKRSKLPANWEAKRRRVEWELMDQNAKEEAEKAGKNYDIVKNMGMVFRFNCFSLNCTLLIINSYLVFVSYIPF